MFSQTVIDNMSVIELVSKIKLLSVQIDNHIQDDPHTALDYCNAVKVLTDKLAESIEDYIAD
jgi:hypothetical protein